MCQFVGSIKECIFDTKGYKLQGLACRVSPHVFGMFYTYYGLTLTLTSVYKLRQLLHNNTSINRHHGRYSLKIYKRLD